MPPAKAVNNISIQQADRNQSSADMLANDAGEGNSEEGQCFCHFRRNRSPSLDEILKSNHVQLEKLRWGLPIEPAP
ncbi:unnamed protein product [Anisakis simplex]|uniref:Uncharacterized protein n=1 Tax=Anisakis simplex TaxID=6269 RepID=A0A0M3K9C5_ANISI|nr:unnamed protein product [Anisakis simplex]